MCLCRMGSWKICHKVIMTSRAGSSGCCIHDEPGLQIMYENASNCQQHLRNKNNQGRARQASHNMDERLSVVMANFECRCGFNWFKRSSQHSSTQRLHPLKSTTTGFDSYGCKKTPKLQTVWIHDCLPVHDIALVSQNHQHSQSSASDTDRLRGTQGERHGNVDGPIKQSHPFLGGDMNQCGHLVVFKRTRVSE